MKKNIIIIIIIIAMLFTTVLVSKPILNIINNMKKENIKLISYQIYDNVNDSDIKTLVNINSENGIEYIIKPDGTKITTNGKVTVAFDYAFQINIEETFKIKEIGKNEIEEKIKITETGSNNYPFIITTADQLQEIQNYKKDVILNIANSKICYKLGENIDLSGINWKPIGTSSEPFEGTLYGNGYTINNLTINNSESYQGLFGYVTGNLDGIIVSNFNVSGTSYIGTIAGFSLGNIKNCKVINSIINATSDYCGGIVGATQSILSSNIVDDCEITGIQYLGGIVGSSSSTVEKNTVNATIIGTNHIGGIVGNSSSVVNDNICTAHISGTSNLGGIVGYTTGDASENSANVKIVGTGNNVGGSIGYVYGGWTNKSVTFANNKAFGQVEGVTNVGGLIGIIDIHNLNRANGNYNYSKCNVISTGSNAGGLIGQAFADAYGGGEKAEIYLNQNYATGNVTSNGNYAGGLIGLVDSIGRRKSRNGTGIIEIQNSFSCGNVTANDYVGSLIGLAKREGNYSGGNIKINYSYSTSKINCTSVNVDYFNYQNTSLDGSFTYLYNYNVSDLTGIVGAVYASDKNSEDMYIQSQFAEWDFTNIWTIDEGISMPYFRNLDKPIEVNKN